MLSSPGIGSGLDIDTIVNQLLLVEQRPLLNLQQKKSKIDVQISAYGQIKSSLSNLQSNVAALKEVNNFNKTKAISADEKIFTATASGTASVERHTIQVTNLAESHRLSSTAFTNEATVIGTGTVTLSTGAKSFQLTIDGTNNTLAGIRDAINNATPNTGITASIVNVDAGSKLILTADNTGASNALQITVSGDGDGNDTDNTAGISRLVYQTSGTQNLTQLQAAEDATLNVNTLAVTRSSNQISDVITGVTLTLKGAGTAELSMQRDFSAVQSAAQSFVNNYNALTSLTTKLRSGDLTGENFLLSIERQTLNLFSTKITGSDLSLSDLGFSFNRQGVLGFDSSKLTAKLDSDLDRVMDLFTKANEGFAVLMHNKIEEYIKTGGLIESRTDGLNSSIKTLDSRILSLDSRLKLTEERLRAQFSALDTLLGGLQATSSFVNQQMSIITAISTNINQNKR